MRRKGFGKGLVTGGIIGIAAATYLWPAITDGRNSKSMKRMKQDSRSVVDDIMQLVDDVRNMM